MTTETVAVAGVIAACSGAASSGDGATTDMRSASSRAYRSKLSGMPNGPKIPVPPVDDDAGLPGGLMELVRRNCFRLWHGANLPICQISGSYYHRSRAFRSRTAERRQVIKRLISTGFTTQSGRPDSDRRHPAWEASALPTELRPRNTSILPHARKLAIERPDAAACLSSGIHEGPVRSNRSAVQLWGGKRRPSGSGFFQQIVGPGCNNPAAGRFYLLERRLVANESHAAAE
jgi:hypothetical protein